MERTPAGRLLFVTALALIFCVQICCAEASEDARKAYYRFFRESLREFKNFEDLEPIIRAAASRRFVLLGESTHGTREYYELRDRICRRLISEHGFEFVAVEGDWQAIYRLNEYVKHQTPDGTDARAVLARHRRWPHWMWANEEFIHFLEWLREHNSGKPYPEKVGIFGIDIQDPDDSMSHVLEWFRKNDPENLGGVQAVYGAVQALPGGFADYARKVARGASRLNLQLASAAQILINHHQSNPGDEETWVAKQNALAVKRAEAQYFGMLLGDSESWNARATWMHELVTRVADRIGTDSKGIVWAHNTHVGDATATDMASTGQVNIGQLMRSSYSKDQVFIIGFASHSGTVVAGANWGEPFQVMEMIPAQRNSYESILHETGLKKAFLIFDEASRKSLPTELIPQRAVGVVYRPPFEAYVPTNISKRYDALIYIDKTTALTPISVESQD